MQRLVGKTVVIRSTAGWTYIGRLREVGPTELVIDQAAWVADSGRWHTFVAGGMPSECEPYPPERLLFVPRIGSEVVEADHRLPLAVR